MAVESFIQPSESKITVEKSVKEKPNIAELTTIEKPGKSIEDIQIDKPQNKKAKQKAKADESKITISKPKKDSILIITEKPQAAAKIAQALGNPRKYSDNKVPYYELEKDGKKIIVASAVGHLFNLTYVTGQSGWPIFKLEWKPSYDSKKAAFTKAYFMTLKKLAQRAKEFYLACDYDIEGEVIGWNVLRFIAKESDAKRMKYSTLTKDELIHSYENPMPTLDWGQAYAGETRHKIDWLYGINLSRALMSAIKRTGSFKILSIGRVQGPALKIIVDRDREIENFKPQNYWQVVAVITANKENLELRHPKDIFNKNELDDFKNIKEGNAETKETQENISPPYPFDLTTLQREAHAHYKISPSRTLQIAQSLYLDGIISYPRTSSQKIPPQIKPKEIIKKLSENFPQTRLATRNNPVEGKKEDAAHPSIFPTGEFKNLSDDEEKLYNLIVKRFIACFCPDAKTANKRITLIADNGKKFTTSGLTIIEKGWTQVYPVTLEEKSIPTVNGHTKIDSIKFEDKITQPPHRYTSASLVSLLEKKNLGTKSTRSSIVDILFDRGYLDGKSIQATPLGAKLIEALEKYSPIIIDENLTRELEKKMDEIQNSKKDLEKKEIEAINTVEKLITDISKEFKAKEFEIGKELLMGVENLREQQKENNNLMPCPVCKAGNLSIRFSKKSGRYFVGCSNYPNCTATYPLPPNGLIKKTDKVSDKGLPILMAIRKGRRPWEFEFNPNWRAENPDYKKQDKEAQDNNQEK